MNQIGIPGEVGQVSDGYHTFDELYEHRHWLFLHFLNIHNEIAFKTRRDHQGGIIAGWFIAGIDTDFGQITYHLPDRLWSRLDVEIIPQNSNYDGHTSQEIISRLGQVLHQLV